MDHAQTHFSPQRNGFRFTNFFENPFSLQYPLPFAGQVDLSKLVNGLCGGMCFAALDYFYANQELPAEIDATRIDRRLFDYLCQRQIDSLQIPVVLRIIEMTLTDDQQLARAVTRSELPKIRRRLDKGHPAVVCLIRERGLGNLPQNHQVLVTGYRVNAENRETVLSLYDPNHPLETPTISICKRNGSYVLEQSTGEGLRGLFLVPYKPVKALPPISPAGPARFALPPVDGVVSFKVEGSTAATDAAEAAVFGAETKATPAFRLRWPVDSRRVNQVFNENPQWYAPFKLPGHEGVDFYAMTNANVYAAADGEVYMAEHPNGHPYGLQVRIRHPFNGKVYHTIYAHLHKLKVKSGQQVKAGDLIGLADNTGNSFGSHLHLTLKLDGAQTPGYPPGIIDPWPYLQEGGVVEEEDEEERELLPPSSGITVFTTAGLNLRDAPSLEGKIIGAIPAGEKLDALGNAEEVKAKIGKPGEWLQVKTASGLAGFVSAPFVTSSEQADFPPTGLVVYPVDALNLRAGPGTGFDVLAGLAVTDPLTVLGDAGTSGERIGKQGEWLHIQTAAGVRGFVAAWLVRLTGQTPPPTDLVVFATSTINVRARPTTESNVLTTAVPEDKLVVLGDRAQAQARIGKMDQWLNVRTPAGFTGYVAAWLVRVSPSKEEETTLTALNVRPTTGVNMRAQPSLGAPRVNGALANELLKVIEADLPAARAKIGLQDRWLYVEKQDGTRGWVAAWFMVEAL